MSVRLIAKKEHIVRNGKLRHTIKKGEEFEIYVQHITKYDKDDEFVSITLYKIHQNDDLITDGWYINLKNFITAEQYIPIKRQDKLNELLK